MEAPRYDSEADFEPLITLKQAQAFLGIGRAFFFRLIRNGELPVVRIGGRTLIRPEALRAFVAERETRASNDDDPPVSGSHVRSSADAGGGNEQDTASR